MTKKYVNENYTFIWYNHGFNKKELIFLSGTAH